MAERGRCGAAHEKNWRCLRSRPHQPPGVAGPLPLDIISLYYMTTDDAQRRRTGRGPEEAKEFHVLEARQTTCPVENERHWWTSPNCFPTRDDSRPARCSSLRPWGRAGASELMGATTGSLRAALGRLREHSGLEAPFLISIHICASWGGRHGKCPAVVPPLESGRWIVSNRLVGGVSGVPPRSSPSERTATMPKPWLAIAIVKQALEYMDCNQEPG
jgi:hypothetical protein